MQFSSLAELRKHADGEAGVTFGTEVLYSYSVLESEYQGTYAEKLGARHEAEQLLQSLKQGPLFVRYNPAAPEDCFMDPYRDVRAV